MIIVTWWCLIVNNYWLQMRRYALWLDLHCNTIESPKSKIIYLIVLNWILNEINFKVKKKFLVDQIALKKPDDRSQYQEFQTYFLKRDDSVTEGCRSNFDVTMCLHRIETVRFINSNMNGFFNNKSSSIIDSMYFTSCWVSYKDTFTGFWIEVM